RAGNSRRTETPRRNRLIAHRDPFTFTFFGFHRSSSLRDCGIIGAPTTSRPYRVARMDKPEYPLVSSIAILVFAAATVAVVAAATLVAGSGWSLAMASLAIALFAYGFYRLLVTRIDHHHRHVQEMSDLHLATIDALAFAIEARDEKGERHVHHMEVYAAG